MTGVEDRIAALQEFCERHDFELKTWRGTQREPGDGLSITVCGVRLISESQDSMAVALARMERAIEAVASARGDAYLHAPHDAMGRVE